MREKSELNHQESFLPSLLYLQPLNAQALSHLSLLRHSHTKLEGDTNVIDGGQSLAAENCEAELSQS